MIRVRLAFLAHKVSFGNEKNSCSINCDVTIFLGYRGSKGEPGPKGETGRTIPGAPGADGFPGQGGLQGVKGKFLSS